MFHSRKSSSKAGRKPAGRGRRFKLAAQLERLEERLTPVVTSVLNSGMLTINMTGEGDRATIAATRTVGTVPGQVSVYSGQTLLGQYAASSVLGVSITGVDEVDDRDVTIQGVLNAPNGLTISNVDDVTFDGGTSTIVSAGSISVDAESISVKGATLSSRRIADGLDPGTAASISASGPISLIAPTIEVADQSRILAHGGQGIRARSVPAGNVTISALDESNVDWALGIGRSNEASPAASITIGAARITGNNVQLDARATNTETLNLESDLADDTRAIAVADFDGDGKLDLATGNNGSQARLYLNNGTDAPLELLQAKNVGEAMFTTAMASADLNADGRPDLVLGASDGKLVYLINNGTSDPFEGVAPVLVDTAGAITALSVADFNADGRLDILAASSNQQGRLYLDSDPAPGVQATPQEVLPIGTSALAVADFNRDGLMDVVAAAATSTSSLFRNTGDPSQPFTPLVGKSIAGSAGASAATAADLNGDNRPDLILARPDASTLVFLNTGNSSLFDGVTPIVVGNDTYDSRAVVAADLNGDNRPEIVVASNDGPVRIYTNQLGSGGGFKGDDAHADIQQAWAVALADVSGDGKLDLIVGNGTTASGGTNELTNVYINTGEASNPFDDAEAQIVTPENELAGELTADDIPALAFLGDLTLLAAIIQVEPTATITVNSGAMIEGVGRVQLSASADAEASVITLGAYLGFNYARVAPVAKVELLGNARITTQGEVNLLTSTSTDLDMQLYVGSKGAVGNLVASYGRTDAESTTRVAAGASISGGNITVRSLNNDIIKQTASALGFQSSRVLGFGATATVGDYDSTTTASLAGTVNATGNVSVYAESTRPTNITRAAATVVEPLQNKALPSKIANKLGTKLLNYSLTSSLGSNILSAWEPGKEENSKLTLSAAVNVSDSDNVVRAAIEGGAQVKANGAVNVIARAQDDFQASATASAGNAQKLSLGGAINVALTVNTADAVIGDGASVDGNQGVRVLADADRPREFNLFNFNLALPNGEAPKTWDDIKSAYDDGVSVAEALEPLVETLELVFATGSILGELSTTLAHSGASANESDSVGIGVGVTYLDMDNRANARIGANARINQDRSRLASTAQDVIVEATATVSTLNLAGQESTLNFSGAFGASGGKGAFGASVNVIRQENSSIASVGDGAQIRAARDVEVSTDTYHYNISVVQAGAAAKGIGIDGSIAFFELDGTSEAWIEDSVRVEAGRDVIVNANQDLFLVNATGGLTVTGGSNLGISGGADVVDLNTRAFIGDTNGTTPGTAAGVSGRDIRVNAVSTNRHWGFSLSGSASVSSRGEAASSDEFMIDETSESGFSQSPLGGKEGGFALSGAAMLHWVDETTEAFLSETGTIRATRDLRITANSDGWYISGVGGWAASDKSNGIGGAFSMTRLDQDTRAYTRYALLNAGSLTVEADSDNLVVNAAAGASGSAKKNSVAGSLGFVRLWTDTVAELGIGTSAQVTAGPVSIQADDELDLWTIAGALSIGTGDDTTLALGAAVALDIIDTTVQATVAPNVVLNATGGSVVISATGDHDIITIGAAVGASTSDGVGAAGSAGALDFDPTIEATIGAGAFVTTAGSLYLNAHHDYDEIVVAGAAAGGQDAGVGIGLALGLMTRTVRASIGDSAVVAALGQGTALSDPDGSGLTGKGLILDATTSEDRFVIAAGIAFATDTAAAVASGAVGKSDSRTEALIGRNALINVGFDPAAIDPDQTVHLRADHDTFFLSAAGAFEAAKSFGLGLAASAFDFDRNTLAKIGDGTKVRARGDVRVEAQTSLESYEVAAAIGLGDNTLQASAVVLDMDNTTEALVGVGAHVVAGGDVVITADNASTLYTIAGAGGISKTAGFGLSNVTLLGTDTTLASVGEGAYVRADGVGTPALVYLGDRNASDNRVNRSVRGVSIGATNDLDILTIAVGAGLSQSVNLIGSVTLTELDQSTVASISDRATVESPGGSVVVAAHDRLKLDGASGQLAASGSVGLGAGVEAASIEKTTLAIIGSASTVTAGDDVDVRARSVDDILSISGAAGIGLSTVGIALSGSGSGLELTTQASIGDGSLVIADGSVVVAARGDLDVLAVAGSLSGGKAASIGTSAVITLITQDTQAFVGSGSSIIARGLDAATTVDTGDFNTDYLDYDEDDATRPPEVDEVDIPDLSFFQDPEATPVTRAVRGLAISAVSNADHQTFAVSGGLGKFALQLVGNIVVPDITTRAYIGSLTEVNRDLGGASEAQSVLVTAGTNWYQLNLGGALAVGVGAISPGVAALTGDVLTEAFVGNSALVRSHGDILVWANTLFHSVPVSAGAGVGGATVIGSLSVLDLDLTTHAYLATGSVADAAGNILVTANDETDVTMIAGNVALSGVGIGASIGFIQLNKDTRAFVGGGAQVNARSFRDNSLVVFTGQMDSDGTHRTENMKGLAVQARSLETIFNVSVSGTASGLVGLAGSVSVEYVNAATYAYIGDGARINEGNANDGAQQDVRVMAMNDLDVYVINGSLSAGLAAVGISGAVDFGIVLNDTQAWIGNNADVRARSDVSVQARALREIETYAIGVGVGTAALQASVSVWGIGGTLPQEVLDVLRPSSGDTTTEDLIDTTASIDTLRSLYTSYTDDNDATTYLRSIGTRSDESDNDGRMAAALSASTDVETAARIGSYASIQAGGSIHVIADEDIVFDGTGGSGAGGLVGGVGAGAVLLNVDSETVAEVQAGSRLDAVSDIEVAAYQDNELTAEGIGGSAGAFIGVAIQYVEIQDNSDVSAHLRDDVVVPQTSWLKVKAKADRELTASSEGGSGTLLGLSAGAAIAEARAGGSMTATIGDRVQIGQEAGKTVTAVTVEATTDDTVTATVFAVEVGIGAGSFNEARVSSTPTLLAEVGDNVDLTTGRNGDVILYAKAEATLYAEVEGYNAGGISVGSSNPDTEFSPTVTSQIGSGSNVSASRDLVVWAVANGKTTTIGEASGGGVLNGHGADVIAYAEPTTLARIGVGTEARASRDASVLSDIDLDITVTAEGITGGVLTVGGNFATATISPTAHAIVGASASLLSGRDIRVEARNDAYDFEAGVAVPRLVVEAFGSSGNLIGSVGSDATLNLTPDTVVRVLGNALVDASGSVDLRATNHHDVYVKSDNNSYGGIAVGNAYATLNVSTPDETDTNEGASVLVQTDEGSYLEGQAVRVVAVTNQKVFGIADAIQGGFLAIGSAQANATITTDTQATLLGDARAFITLQLRSEEYTQIMLQGNEEADGGAIGTAYSTLDVVSDVTTTVGSQANLRAPSITIRAIVPQSLIENIADGYTAGAGTITVYADTDIDYSVETNINQFAEVLARDFLAIEASNDAGKIITRGNSEADGANKPTSSTISNSFSNIKLRLGDGSLIQAPTINLVAKSKADHFAIGSQEWSNLASSTGTVTRTNDHWAGVVMNGEVRLSEAISHVLNIRPDGSIDPESNVPAQETPDGIVVPGLSVPVETLTLNIETLALNVPGTLSGSGTINAETSNILAIENRSDRDLYLGQFMIGGGTAPFVYDKGATGSIPVIQTSQRGLYVENFGNSDIYLTRNIEVPEGTLEVLNHGGGIFTTSQSPNPTFILRSLNLQATEGSLGSLTNPLNVIVNGAGSITAIAPGDVMLSIGRTGISQVSLVNNRWTFNETITLASIVGGGDVRIDLPTSVGQTPNSQFVSAESKVLLQNLEAGGTAYYRNQLGDTSLSRMVAGTSMEVRTGGQFFGLSNGGANLTAPQALVLANRGVDLFRTAVDRLAVSAGSGQAWFEDQLGAGNWQITEIAGTSGVSAAGSILLRSPNRSILVQGNIDGGNDVMINSGGNVEILRGLDADRDLKIDAARSILLRSNTDVDVKRDTFLTAFDDLTLESGAILYSEGNLFLRATNDLLLAGGSSVKSGSLVSLVGALNGDGTSIRLLGSVGGPQILVGGGNAAIGTSTIEIAGDLSSPNIQVTALRAFQMVHVKTVVVGNTMNINSGTELQTVLVGDGTLLGIRGILRVNGNSLLRRTNLVIDSTAAPGASGQLTSSTLTGLGMGTGRVEFSRLLNFNVNLSDGNDSFEILSVPATTNTRIEAGGAADSIRVLLDGLNGPTHIQAPGDTVTLWFQARPDSLGAQASRLTHVADTVVVSSASQNTPIIWSYNGSLLQHNGVTLANLGGINSLLLEGSPSTGDRLNIATGRTTAQYVDVMPGMILLADRSPFSLIGPVLYHGNIETISIHTDGGDDQVKVTGTSAGTNLLINTNAGNDEIIIFRAGLEGADNTKSVVQAVAGAGNDRIEIDNDLADVTIVAVPDMGLDTVDIKRTAPRQVTTVQTGQEDDAILVQGHRLASNVQVRGGGVASGLLRFQTNNLLIDRNRSSLTSEGTPTTPSGALFVAGSAGGVTYQDIRTVDVIAPIVARVSNADINGRITIRLGQSLTLTALGHVRPLTTYRWDLNNDGRFDLSGRSLTIPWSTLNTFGLNRIGSFTVRLRVTDDLNQLSETTVIVNITF